MIKTFNLALALFLLGAVPAALGAQRNGTAPTIFYSGIGGAGTGAGVDAGAFVMIDAGTSPGPYPVWTSRRRCDSSNAFPRPGRAINALVGYSLGRLGPAYYLQQLEQRNARGTIRSVVLLDPGARSDFDCDRASGAGRTYATWLRQNSANRLLIIAANRSAEGGYAGVKETYASQLSAAKAGAGVAARALICTANVRHTDVPRRFQSLIGPARTTCPSGTAVAPFSPTRSIPSTGPTPTPTPVPTSTPGARRVVTVDNRVTNGGTMREDATPVRLTTEPRAFCTSRGCNINGTERGSGGTYDAATCQTQGERITNGDDDDPSDDANPERFESTRYYGVRLPDGTFGYVSEVWVVAADRGGLALPGC